MEDVWHVAVENDAKNSLCLPDIISIQTIGVETEERLDRRHG